MFLLMLLSWLVGQARQQEAEQGQGLVEYAILMVFVAVLVMALLVMLGPAVSNMFQTVYSSFTGN